MFYVVKLYLCISSINLHRLQLPLAQAVVVSVGTVGPCLAHVVDHASDCVPAGTVVANQQLSKYLSMNFILVRA